MGVLRVGQGLGGGDQPEVAEGLREVPQQLPGGGADLLGEQPERAGEPRCPLEDSRERASWPVRARA